MIVVGAGVAFVPEPEVEACGPDFPTNMIIRRADALATMWDGSFAEEVGKLVPVPARDREVFGRGPAYVVAMAREDALYTSGAQKFRAGSYEEAARDFEALLRLPPSERERWSMSATYSLGRAYDVLHRNAKAIAAYRTVRELARAGFVDDDGLALSSLGQEARTAWRESTPQAIRLYAQQAALGGTTGATSLLQLVRQTDAKERRVLYRDDVSTALFALYYYTRGNELSDEERAAWKKELGRAVTSSGRGAAYMAAASYRAGEWAAAARFAAMSKAPIATWVKAKLALRDGDRATAEALLREVEKAGLQGNRVESEIASYELDSDPSSLVRAELGLLALAGDRFAESAAWFGKANRTPEAAYVVERAMSMDELLAEVQRTQAARAIVPAAPDGVAADAVCRYWDATTEQDRAYCWGRLLLDIYARRLLRAHRYDEALEAFGANRPTADDDVDGDEATDNDPDPAGTFVAEMKRAAATTGIERAEHLFAASRTLRSYGMEIAGTEVGPDWRIYDGGYEGETLCLPSPVHGYSAFAVPDESGDIPYEWDAPCVKPTKGDAALVTPLEVARVRASAPEIDQRFSYRYVASKLAEEAAGLVPPRSQAYATMLCWAALYAKRDQARVDELYAMYVRNGATGFSIAADCEEPDFRRARHFEEEQAQRRAEQVAAAQRAREWTWPRIRDAAWRRRGWLAYPIAAIALLLLARFVFARAAYSPGFARDPSSKRTRERG
ncbi:MAG: tol-pal system YbgF family protein [Kofleriaceae bacterium]